MLKAIVAMGVISATGVPGCDVGEVPIGNGGIDAGTSPGELSFNAMIVPLVTECVTGGCHTIQQPILTSFGELGAPYKVKPGATNILVTKGDLTAGVHSGLPYLTTGEQAIVAGWIDSL